MPSTLEVAARQEPATSRLATLSLLQGVELERLPILQAAHWTATSATSIGSSPTSARWRPRDNPQAVSGLDFVLLDGERASSLYAFVDNPADGRPAS